MSAKDLASPEGGRGRYWIHTYGCQMNVHDSEIYAGQLRHLGFVPADDPLDADVILLNTCSVREKAEEKLFSELGRLRVVKDKDARFSPSARVPSVETMENIDAGRRHVRERQVRIGVTGCIAQQRGEQILSRESSVDFVLGTRALRALPSVLEALEAGEGPQVVTDDLIDFDASDADRGDRIGAYVTIMEGCDNYCSFCIVPSTRGREVFRSTQEILDEVRALSMRGYREVTLLGQNVNSWADAEAGADFPQLLRHIDHLLSNGPAGGVERVRFLTPHPKDLSPDLIEIMTVGTRIAKHIHLPVQSGSDEILRRMNRHYTSAGYIDLVESLRRSIPDVGLSTDLIVGFPGESDEDFEATMDLVRQARYDSFFSFEYSPRPDTAATRYEDAVPPELKRERLIRLQEEQRRIQTGKNADWIGSTVEVLVEGFSRRTESDVMGRISSNQVVNFPAEASLIGKLVTVQVVGSSANSLYGEPTSTAV
jgi:tRNA-2-methylthio-N6-dimethylallyladenosine synthase